MTSDDLAQETAAIKRDEGLRLHPYTDTVGVLTIGYGRNLVANGIKEAEAELMLQHDIQAALASLTSRYVWFDAQPVRVQRVLLNMAFNLGAAKLATFRRFLAAVERGDYLNAEAEMMDSAWSSQVGTRAHRLAGQLRGSA